MTEDMKMYHFVVTDDGEYGAWEPLDPQPSCKNCGRGNCEIHNVLYEYHLGCRTNPAMLLNFFCKHWEMKE